jgi:hypothetical protein
MAPRSSDGRAIRRQGLISPSQSPYSRVPVPESDIFAHKWLNAPFIEMAIMCERGPKLLSAEIIGSDTSCSIRLIRPVSQPAELSRTFGGKPLCFLIHGVSGDINPYARAVGDEGLSNFIVGILAGGAIKVARLIHENQKPTTAHSK